jgi:hypothetical protein
MIRAVVAIAAVVAGLSGCTLVLQTDQLIKPCSSPADCDKGFICQENSCLPADDADANAGEGEGEGEGEGQ